MRARGGDFESAFNGFLAFDVGEVEVVIGGLVEDVGEIDFGGCDFELAFEEGDGFAEVSDGQDLETLNDGGFGGVFGSDEEADFAVGTSLKRDG